MPGGRPPKIDQVVDTFPAGHPTRAGEPMTAGEKVVERVRALWAPWASAAVSADVRRQTVHEWHRKGANARAKALRGERLTRNERLYAEFADSLEKAEEEAHLRILGTLGREAQGGYVITKTVTKTVAGKVTEKVVTEETARPTWQALCWLLERKKGAEYPRPAYEVTGPAGEPLVPKAERADALAEALEAYQRGLDDGVARAKEAADGVGSAARPEQNGSPNG